MSLVTNGKIPGGLTPEEKLAKKVVSELGHVNFNVALFTQSLTILGGDNMEPRILNMVKEVIGRYADMHDAGFKSKTTREAKRMRG